MADYDTVERALGLISREMYEKCKDVVLRHSNAVQGTSAPAPKSDRELAEELGVSEGAVAEIRTIAKALAIPLEAWRKAEEFKESRRGRALIDAPGSGIV